MTSFIGLIINPQFCEMLEHFLSVWALAGLFFVSLILCCFLEPFVLRMLPSPSTKGISMPVVRHFLKNLGLLALSIFFLPLNTFIALGAYLWLKVPSSHPCSQYEFPRLEEGRRTVLVTGTNMAKGLTLARLFHRRGHRVIGADTHACSIGRVSSAVDTYYQLSPPPDSSHGGNDPYLNRLLEIVRDEKVDLWISVSDVNAAVEDAMVKEIIQARTSTKAIQFGVRQIQLLHEKHLFMDHCKSLGLPVPDSEVVRSKEEVVTFLKRRGSLTLEPNGKQYLLKPIDVDDLARFSMPLLPLSSESATLDRLSSVPFPKTSAYILQEFISGPEYCTHALIVRGQVRAFVACPSEGVLMHYTALPPDSALSKAMLEFTKRVAEEGGEEFTGHMSFDFLVKDVADKDENGGTREKEEQDVIVYPIECNPRVHTAIVLFNDTPELVDEYLSVLSPSPDTNSSEKQPLAASNPQRYYWLGQDLIEQVFHPLYCFLFRGTTTFTQVCGFIQAFVDHVLNWKDGTFEAWDPWPWWWLYHVYWPIRFSQYLVNGSWQKLNVSTGKAFKAD
ncbi:Fc.00g057400.m01.CDS01 [Cosmosporella sp. VM-42]